MKQHTKVTSVLNVMVVGLAFAAWLSTIGSSVSSLEIASLLGVLAFGLMWVHYVADAIAPRSESEQSKDVQYVVSRYAVLVAILSHPFLINYYLVTNNFGFPPGGYEALLGDLAVVVLLGWIALVAFLLFEFRKKLRKFDRYIFHANTIAMFLVLMHGFVIGMVMMTTWFVWIWHVYLLVFTAVIYRRYAQYYVADPKRRMIAYIVVTYLALTVFGMGVQTAIL